MSQKKRGLGKGLSELGLNELLGDLEAAPAAVADMQSESVSGSEFSELAASGMGHHDGDLRKLPIDVIKPGKYQPRKVISESELEALAASIRNQGVIQPIVVRPIENHQYEIIAGERRWRAARLAELSYIPALVRDVSDEAALAMALIENIQRKNLNAIEEAQALQRLIDEFDMTHQAAADAVGKSRVNVTNLLRLLKLNEDVRGLVEKGHLEMGHARALLTLDHEAQSEIANIIVARALSVRETEDLIRKMSGAPTKEAVNPARRVVLKTLQEQIARKLGANVSIAQNAKGRGKIVIKYASEAELEGILGHLQ